ncbi:MAG: threonylcarbamoyl-AMP synthase [Candidatus Magasanikbacteria bacterium RIFOXYD2_FULL_39_9]|nr:MAG: threonylcarbamoyl-AMP synthase [Candidatus Magasanikbacteria bacterium RIFOXYD2_FULL_39_9]
MQILKECYLSQAVASLLEGKVLVFPTETSYGLGCDATSQKSVDKIFKMKGRGDDKPLLIVVPTIDVARKYLEWNDAVDRLAKAHWPGALTIVGMAKPNSGLANGVISKFGTVAVRVSANNVVKFLSESLGKALVATSANISGAGDVYNSSEAQAMFSEKVFQPDIILDYGQLEKRPPTTIVDATKDKIKILRQGQVKIKFREFFSIKIKPWIAWMVIGIGAILFSILFLTQYVLAMAETESMSAVGLFQADLISGNHLVNTRYKRAPIKVKGLYLTAYSAGGEKKMDSIIKLINETELNAVVIDLKDYSGKVLYDSKIPLVDNLKLQDIRIKNVEKLLAKLDENNIYKIARISVFQDPILAEKKPQWSIKSKQGGLWRDKNHLAWVDPANPEVWKYVISVAKEAGRMGFDEINFDYIRFPTDGRMSDIVYTNGNSKRYEVVAKFFKFLSKEMEDEPVFISADLFGLTTEKKGEDDMQIGQRLSDAVLYFDYVMPMVYPSHCPSGYRGYKNPANYPYEVVYQSMKAGVKQAEGKKAKLRSWIQAFNLGAVYDGAKIKSQIKATDDAGADGWVLWNAANRYTSAGLEKE